ncbi:LytTR family transcriptional regulator [Methanobrevibacter sp. OttesenSCG-928-I08]|nr:LytTR family transcriptional regulator [Methanobrevibacter sp. OttesenSCG-928-I08]
MNILNFNEIFMIKTENKQNKVYTYNNSFITDKKLYELEDILDDSFIRISKSSIINIGKIDHVAPSFKGIMFISLKNGLKDNISRKYLPIFKEKLGLK